MQPATARKQLGEFLRAKRDRLRPADFALPPGQRRRAPGLRREEVATLCGISPTWLTWIEQGRTTAVSVATLAAIARGLRLSQAERSYLFELAEKADPSPRRTLPTDLQETSRLIASFREPAYVLDRHWQPIAWNRRAAALFPGWLGTRAPASNLLGYVFLDASARHFIVDWRVRARRLVAEYRADTAAWRDDPVREALIRELSSASADFATIWAEQAVQARDGGRRRFDHPRLGRIVYDQQTLRPADRPELKVVVLLSLPR